MAAHALLLRRRGSRPRSSTIRCLDEFDDIAPWKRRVRRREGVACVPATGCSGNALRAGFRSRGTAGYAARDAPLPIELPDNYEIAF